MSALTLYDHVNTNQKLVVGSRKSWTENINMSPIFFSSVAGFVVSQQPVLQSDLVLLPGLRGNL